MSSITNNPRCIKLSVHQLVEIDSYTKQIRDLVNQQGRFVAYCVREAGSLEKGPFEVFEGHLVPKDLMPIPVKLT